LFSRGANSHDAPPNTQLDLFDVSLPGTLPQLNSRAVKTAILAGLGLNCEIQNVIHFDRKNYFYSDMPSGYQITQYTSPIAKDGYVDFIVSDYNSSSIAHTQPYDVIKYLFPRSSNSSERSFAPYIKRSHISQIQLEQDSAKTLSQVCTGGYELNSLVDYNRSGCALIEIVFQPDLCNPHEASSLVRELSHILRTLSICSCELQEGTLRVDANVSIKRIGDQLMDPQSAKRVELKNLNSLRALNRGLYSEIRRQTDELLLNKCIVQESRSYSSKLDQTRPLRLKADSTDYRYMPEPSLPPLAIDLGLIEEMSIALDEPSLPKRVRELLEDKYNLNRLLIVELIGEPGLSRYFLQIMENNETRKKPYDPDTVADFLIYAVANLKSIQISPIRVDLTDEDDFLKRLSVEKMQTIFDMLFNDEISFINALEIMRNMLVNDVEATPERLVDELNLRTINDDEEISRACSNILAKMKNISKKYRKTGDIRYLRMMLDKMNELHHGRLSFRKAIKFFENARQEYELSKKIKT